MLNINSISPEMFIAIVIASAYVWVQVDKLRNRHHVYLIHRDNFKVYWRGSFCLLEIDCGKHTIQLFTNRGIINHFSDKGDDNV